MFITVGKTNSWNWFIYLKSVYLITFSTISPRWWLFQYVDLYMSTCTRDTCIQMMWDFFFFACVRAYTGWPRKNGNSRYSRFSGLCSNQQLLSSLCWIEHLFPIIITSRSSNLVKNFLFYETFLMDCHFRDLPDFQSFAARWQINGKSQNDSRSVITHKIKSFQPNLMILVLL